MAAAEPPAVSAPSTVAAPPVAAAAKRGLGFRPAPPPAKLAQFYQQLGRQLTAGVGLDDALMTLLPIAGRRSTLGLAIAELRRSLAEGLSLSAAMARQPHAFDAVAVALVESATQTGHLPATCERLRARAQLAAELRAGLIKSLAYPVLMLVTSWVLQPVPLLLTEGASAFASALGLRLGIALGVSLVLGLGLPRLWARPGVRQGALRWWTATPVLRLWANERRWAMVLGTLAPAVEVGMPLPRALELAGTASGETELPAKVAELNQRMRAGAPLHEALGHLPGAVEESLGLIAAGERSGHLVEALAEQAEHWQQRWHRAVRWFSRGVRGLLSVTVLVWVAVGVAGQMRQALDPFQGREGKQLQKEFDSVLRQMPKPDAKPVPSAPK